MAYSRDDITVRMLDFDEIKVGDVAELKHVLTKEDVQAFAALTGDFNPLHVDEEFAKRTLFQKPVVHGMLSASFISTIIGTLLPGGGALWMSQTLEFLRPAHIGDTIRVQATVKQRSPATRVLILNIVVFSQNGEELIKGESSVKVLELKNEVNAMSMIEKKTVLITGGSGGIGAAVAQKLAAEGHAVIVHFHSSPDNAEQVVNKILLAGGKAISIKANLVVDDEISQLFTEIQKKLGPVQAVVHCASPNNAPRPFDRLDWAAMQEQMDVNLRGAFNCAQAALPGMVAAKSGDLIFIGTVYTDGVPPPQQARYIVAKSALVSLARCLAVEYGSSDIRVNVVAPGMTETGMIADLPDKVKLLTKMQTPLRRLAQPEDIADMVAFLLSNAARHITGQTIRVCGGSVMI